MTDNPFIAKLSIVYGNKQTDSLSLLSGESYRIGRHKDNDVVLDDTLVSRYHTILSVSNSGVLVSDLGSMNGTYVNSKRILTPVILNTEDSLTIGETQFEITELNFLDTADSTVTEAFHTHPAEMKASAITILLVDVCQYTRMSENMPNADVAAMLQKWFDVVGEVIISKGGIIDKYIGDCVMAIWESKKSEASNAADAAMDAAVEIIEATNNLAATLSWAKYAESHPWSCRAAINSGEALLGLVGSGHTRNFTVLGDSVNVAFRVESVASEMSQQTVLTEETYRLLSNAKNISFLCETKVDGREEPVRLYYVP